jgi:hypothetical protein
MKVIRKNITLAATALLFGTQSIMGSLGLANKNPSYFSLLTNEEQAEYNSIRAMLGSEEFRYRRNNFHQMLAVIKRFVEGDPDRIWARAQACGICWVGRCIVKNTLTLKNVFNKSKSSINGSFQQLGYVTKPTVNMQRLLPEFLKELPHAEKWKWAVMYQREEIATPSATIAHQPPPITVPHQPLPSILNFLPSLLNHPPHSQPAAANDFESPRNHLLGDIPPSQLAGDGRLGNRRVYHFEDPIFPSLVNHTNDFGSI